MSCCFLFCDVNTLHRVFVVIRVTSQNMLVLKKSMGFIVDHCVIHAKSIAQSREWSSVEINRNVVRTSRMIPKRV